MAHTFKISIVDDLSSTLRKVEQTIVQKGGSFKGDMNQGEFSGSVKGRYVVFSHSEVEITILSKPFVMPNSMIESAIRDYFA